MTDLPSMVAAFLEFAAGTAFDPLEERVALATYRELVDRGIASVGAIAARADLDAAEVEATLAAWKAIFRATNGDVVAFLGLTGAEMPHRIRFGDVERSAWCAWDTLFLPAVVGCPAHVRAVDPVTGAAIALDVAPDATTSNPSHEGLVLSFREPPPEGLTDEVQNSFCHFVHFFESARSAAAWVADHPGTFVMSLEEGAELARRANAIRYPTTIGAASGASSGARSTGRPGSPTGSPAAPQRG